MKDNFAFKVALRNLTRRRRRTILLILGMALANTLMIWMMSFRESSFKTMMDNILGMKYGTEQITAQGHYDFHKGSINPNKTLSKEEAVSYPNYHSLTFRTQSMILLCSDYNSVPLLVNGYDLKRELAITKLSHLIPSNFTFKNKFPLILGKRAAESLSVKVGDEVAAIGQAVDGSVANEMFTVEMILDLGGGEFEKTFAVTNLADMQEFLALPSDRVHLIVNFNDPIPSFFLEPTVKRIGWRKLLPEIASSSGFMEKFTRFYAIFFGIVASLAMANTLSLSFLERVKEYRMSTIIGAPVQWLRKTIIAEIGVVIGLSLVIGNLFAALVIGIFYFFPLDLALLTGGAPLHMGGMVLTQAIQVKPFAWIFIASNLFFIFTLALASLYPISIVLKKAQKI